jgi:hypothetical protein
VFDARNTDKNGWFDIANILYSCYTDIKNCWKNAVGRQRNLGLQSNLSIRSSVLTSHLQLNIAFSCLVMEKFISIELILRGSFSYKAIFSLQENAIFNCRWLVKTGERIDRFDCSPRFLCRPTAFFQLAGAVGRQRALHTENSRFAHATLPWHISTFCDYRCFLKPCWESANK